MGLSEVGMNTYLKLREVRMELPGVKAQFPSPPDPETKPSLLCLSICTGGRLCSGGAWALNWWLLCFISRIVLGFSWGCIAAIGVRGIDPEP